MKKSMIVCAMLITAAVLAIALGGDGMRIQYFIGTDTADNIARVVLIGMLMKLLVVSQPRAKVFRVMLALIGAGVASYALLKTTGYQLQIIDAGVYVLASLILLIESLEPEPTTSKSLSSQKAM